MRNTPSFECSVLKGLKRTALPTGNRRAVAAVEQNNNSENRENARTEIKRGHLCFDLLCYIRVAYKILILKHQTSRPSPSTFLCTIMPWKSQFVALFSDSQKDMLAGGVSGCVAKTFTAPLSRLTALSQVQSIESGFSLRSVITSVGKILREEGLWSLWKGNFSSIIHRFPYSSINFASYSMSRNALVEGTFYLLPVPSYYVVRISFGGNTTAAPGLWCLRWYYVMRALLSSRSRAHAAHCRSHQLLPGHVSRGGEGS